MKNTLIILFFCFTGVAYGLSPKKEYAKTPKNYQLSYEVIKISTTDNFELNAWYFHHPSSEHVVIVSHDGSGNMGDYLSRIKLLHNYGISVLAYDYRGFGSSQDFSIDPLCYIYPEFHYDLDAIIDYASNRFEQEIVLYGWGIGASISINEGYQNSKVSGIIADDPFTDVYQLESIFNRAGVIMHITNELKFEKFNPIQVVSKESKLQGILLYHGNGNYLFNTQNLESLFNNISISNKEFHVFEKSRHMNNFKSNESEYARVFYSFIINI